MAQEQILEDDVPAWTNAGQDGREQHQEQFKHPFSIADLRPREDLPPHNVAADRAQVRQVLRENAREIEGLAAGSTPASAEPVASRRQRLASLLPKPAQLSPHEERPHRSGAMRLSRKLDALA
jgi:hypothetical protein